uniref:Neur_chan_memb domain-containing protein n=1 Tax=Angiostrongylus costaricensis TaxID=334426 RepID=A0A158PHK9_ANGCS
LIIFRSSCPLDVKHYPFDRQICTLSYGSWAYDGSKIDLVLISEKGDQSNYMMSTEWDLLQISAEKSSVVYSCCPDAPYPFVFNLILPCVLISGIALLGFYMPSDSGEKVTLGITSLLSTTVFLMLVAEGMPPTSEALPLIGIYYIVTIFLVSLATAMTVFTLNIHHQGVHGCAVPPILQKIVFRYLARVLFVRIDPYHSITHHVRHLYQKEHPDEKEHLRHDYRCFEYSPEFRAEYRYLNPTKPRVRLHSGSLRIAKQVSFSSPVHSAMPQPTSTPAVIHKPLCSTEETNSLDSFESEFLRIIDLVHATIERNEMRVAEHDRRDATQLEWQQVAMVLDRFLLIVFVCGTALSSFVILYQRWLGIFE